jgi:membrane protein YdbS with pleckstrin-like domain
MKRLSPKAILKWLVAPVSVFIIISILIFIILYVWGQGVSSDFLKTYLIISVLVLISMLVAVLIRYYSYEYELSEKNIIFSKGIFHKQNITMPYENVQDVQKDEDPFDLIFGLSTIKIETAGGVAANIKIPSVDNSFAVDKMILEKKAKVKHKTTSEETLTDIKNAIIILSEEMERLRDEFNTLSEIIVEGFVMQNKEKFNSEQNQVVKKKKRK